MGGLPTGKHPPWLTVVTSETKQKGNFPRDGSLSKSSRREGRPDVTTATAPAAPLTAIDRCDRCGAQAYLRVSLKSGGELLFCAHHAREHSEKLREIAEHVHDETDKLADTPGNAPDGEL
jgi:hypothetical protein